MSETKDPWEDNDELFERYRETGNINDRNKAVLANQRFVEGYAPRFYRQGSPLEIEDLIQEGKIGLVKGTSKFDLSKGYHFLTYGIWWIRQSIMRAISNQERMVRVPTNLDLRLRRIEKSSNEYHKEYGQIPTEKELADYMGKSLQEIRALRSYEHNTFSLDYIVENGEDKGSQILPPDNSTEDIHIQTERRDLIESLFEDSKLTLKEKDVLIKRNGLNNEGVYTLKEIGDLYGLTRERIRQIENRAIEKIKKKVKHLGLKMEDLI